MEGENQGLLQMVGVKIPQNWSPCSPVYGGWTAPTTSRASPPGLERVIMRRAAPWGPG